MTALDRLRRALRGAVRPVERLRQRLRLHARAETFGAIVHLPRPRALVFVDRAFARALDVTPLSEPAEPNRTSTRAGTGELGAAPLSAPLEAHLQLTNRCQVGCQGCYTGAVARPSSAEWGLGDWKRAIDELAAMQVFHLALGGGESAELPWLGEIARYARQRGLIPNLTTSGLSSLETVLDCAHVFGRINVSIDGLGDDYRRVRGVAGFDAADRAVERLRAVKRDVGINVVVTRQNFDSLPEIFRYARRRRLSEVELLRFKPAGRGKHVYDQLRCTDEQHRRFYPTVRAAAARHRMRVRVDCSYTPMLAHHDPGPAVMRALAVYGCTAGDFLIGVKATGQVTGCSFAPAEPSRPRVTELRSYWRDPNAFRGFRSWRDAAEPCASCRYHGLCRGGCKVASPHVHGDVTAPDPECPRVIDHQTRAAGPPVDGALHQPTSRRTRLRVVR